MEFAAEAIRQPEGGGTMIEIAVVLTEDKARSVVFCLAFRASTCRSQGVTLDPAVEKRHRRILTKLGFGPDFEPDDSLADGPSERPAPKTFSNC